MGLQNSLTSGESQRIFRVEWRTRRFLFCSGRRKRLRDNLKQAGSRHLLGADSQYRTAALAQYVQNVSEHLKTNLKQLIGVSDHFRKCGIEAGLDIYFQRFPVRLIELDRRPRQRVQIERNLGCGRMASKADQAGDQGSSAPNILADPGCSVRVPHRRPVAQSKQASRIGEFVPAGVSAARTQTSIDRAGARVPGRGCAAAQE